ncbi:hypothetical protein [Pectinatus frisingensis]|uniref:hypothetical protein n=1 Tax=Pectinatus frisingensis TaxID=865 RepID=UPI0018C6F58E|nr:hypothetical protein [Pectinatus frisingensis]
MGTASTKAKNKYNKKAYDSILLRIPVGEKSIWQEIAAKNSSSLNEFIIKSVKKEIICQKS